MTIVFSMKVQSDSNKVQVLMLCPECREELEVATNQIGVRFRCSEHGELGMLSAAEFKEGLRKAQRRFGKEHGLGEPVRINFLPAEPERVN
jgi:hypothetical protein